MPSRIRSISVVNESISCELPSIFTWRLLLILKEGEQTFLLCVVIYVISEVYI